MNTIQIILNELEQLSQFIDENELKNMVEMFYKAKKENSNVFLAGAGRSGCIARAFANRLMHLGFNCFVVGDITTKPIQKEDILFILSGSGKTSSLVSISQKAKQFDAHILTITLQKDGDIGKIASASIVLPGTTRLQDKVMFQSIQPVGSSFEQLAWLTCDALIMLLKEKLNLSNDDLIKHHVNLE